MEGETQTHAREEIKPPIQPTQVFSLEKLEKITSDLTDIVRQIRADAIKAN